MVRQIDVEKAKAQFARLVAAAAKGEEIVLTKGGKPMAKLVAAPGTKSPEKREPRKFGQLAHLVDPKDKRTNEEWLRDWRKLDEEILQDFECLREDSKGYDSKWPDTSSTPTRSSGRKRSQKKSVGKRLKK